MERDVRVAALAAKASQPAQKEAKRDVIVASSPEASERSPGPLLFGMRTNRGETMRIRTNTTLTPTGKAKVRTTTRFAPMMPALRTSSTFSLAPVGASGRKRRRTKKKR